MKLKTIYQTTFALLFSIAVGLSSAIAEGPKVLSAAEIRKAFVGNTMNHEKIWAFFDPDGTLRAKSKGRGAEETGKYTISDDGIWCRQWKKWRGGNKVCGKIVKAGDEYGRLEDGEVGATWKITKGNPEGL